MPSLEERIAAHNRGDDPPRRQALAGNDHPPGYTRWKQDGNFSREISSSAAKSADDLMAARRSYGAKRQPKATSTAKTSTPSDPLAALRAAVRARGEAEAAVSAALLSVREAGGSMTKAAAALGVSRQAAYKALERASA